MHKHWPGRNGAHTSPGHILSHTELPKLVMSCLGDSLALHRKRKLTWKSTMPLSSPAWTSLSPFGSPRSRAGGRDQGVRERQRGKQRSAGRCHTGTGSQRECGPSPDHKELEEQTTSRSWLHFEAKGLPLWFCAHQWLSVG